MYYDIMASGQRIQQLRETRNETQEALCEHLNISISMLKKIETGRKGISIDMLVVFAQHFDTSLDYIILGRNITPTNLKSKLRLLIDSLQEIEKTI